MHKVVNFELSEYDFNRFDATFPNRKSNHDIGNFGVQVVKLYLESIGYTNVIINHKKVDIQGTLNNVLVKFEVKSTVKSEISYDCLKVSSPKDYKSLTEDKMEIIRVCNVGQRNVNLHFLKYGIDYILVEEPRWRLQKIRK
ncbi:hypothetical protein EG347_07080 [Chryseobacterium sp. G0186]|uniref:hypothetical protein n=1 Tax=Chryseobacterium sp. G0186 TaxID=2487064 RepID=UPI000F50E0F6|nr:hypothetical protein [Chryseobacterium sp. G0186]AZA77284.1 hypothetical protein EG347_07080 [Chryseobacterium sp. G0186]